MREAPVGWQCASCVRDGARRSPVVRWRPSAGAGVGPLGRVRVTPAVIALIVVDVVVFLWQQRHPSFTLKYALLPFYVHYDHRWYELITSAFLHENYTHILLNMLTLAIIGPAVEHELGVPRFIGLYLLAAVGGSVGYYLLAPQNVYGLGASGAIFGLMGAYLVLAARRRWEIQTILTLLLVNVAFSFTGGVAWQDHLGGLVVGSLACLGMVWVPRHVGRPTEIAEMVQALAVAVVVMIALGVLVQLPPGHVNI